MLDIDIGMISNVSSGRRGSKLHSMRSKQTPNKSNYTNFGQGYQNNNVYDTHSVSHQGLKVKNNDIEENEVDFNEYDNKFEPNPTETDYQIDTKPSGLKKQSPLGDATSRAPTENQHVRGFHGNTSEAPTVEQHHLGLHGGNVSQATSMAGKEQSTHTFGNTNLDPYRSREPSTDGDHLNPSHLRAQSNQQETFENTRTMGLGRPLETVRESHHTDATQDEAMDFVNNMFKKSKIEIRDNNVDGEDTE